MNFLLVMPRIVSKVGDAYQFPLGIPYISAVLKKANYKLYTINLNQMSGTVGGILKKAINEYNRLFTRLCG